MTTSNASPLAMRLARAPAVSLATTTLCPVCFSNSGATAMTTDLKAPAVNTVISAADEAVPASRAPSASHAAATLRNVAMLPLTIRKDGAIPA